MTLILDDRSGARLIPSGIPLYQQVKHQLLQDLASGQWKQGDMLPAEKQLAERFGVSIGTLRKAVDDLVAEDILTRHQGRGTYVTPHARNQHYFKFFRIVHEHGSQTFPASRLLSFERAQATEAQCALFGLSASNSGVFNYVNLLSLDGERILTDAITVPEALFHGMTYELLENRPSTLYSLYQEHWGVNIISTQEYLTAILADARDREALQVPVGSPILRLRRLAYSYEGLLAELRISHINSEHHGYQP